MTTAAFFWRIRPPQASAPTARMSVCSLRLPDWLSSLVQVINDALRTYGLPGPIELPANSSSKCTVMANVLYALLQHRSQVDEQLKEQSEDIKKLQFDLNVARNNQLKLKEQVASTFLRHVCSPSLQQLKSKEEDCKRLYQQLSEATLQHKKEKSKILQEKEKSAAEKTAMQHRDSQLQHAMRKLEQQREKLQERVKQLIDQRDRQLKAGIEMSTKLTTKDELNKRPAWGSNACGSEEFFSKVIRSYEQREAEMLEENKSLRQAMAGGKVPYPLSLCFICMLLYPSLLNFSPVLSKELMETLNHTGTLRNSGKSRTGDEGDEVEPKFEMPFQAVSAEIQSSLRDRMASLRLRLKELEDKENNISLSNTSHAHVAELENELCQARNALVEQEGMVKAYLLHSDQKLCGSPARCGGGAEKASPVPAATPSRTPDMLRRQEQQQSRSSYFPCTSQI
ncbi:hypothetical protein GUITHDRAFT_142845 [Guillardia theta CCMP2712]|uniref:Uncharacterized protein n=1 Tax=Guillardia theta (strain CCMP2712) TaxID=905079 RepID=L1IVU9_GUITC|nr:hypothetical protein GUITHDRAFT_142845 [Guillardia theta CCMP2712]EKX40351.1 hypothetical protein GUITHDRAFT_142845 [Guillardia theta CCMP2712]|eukprot:XP_005827331.1 hypothetical protein GUITHDRAFT_142845 [Guillardia theta CCMP2712]